MYNTQVREGVTNPHTPLSYGPVRKQGGGDPMVVTKIGVFF